MSKRCKFFVYLFCLLFVMFFIFLILYIVFYFGLIKPRFTLKGEKEIKIGLNETYIEEGYEVFYHFKSYNTEVEITSNVKENKIGLYNISYYVPSLNIREERTVQVVDNKEPILTLQGDKTVYTFINQEYKEEGASAYDNCDKDLTNSIKIKNEVNTSKVGTYTIVYSVSDTAGNTATLQRKVVVCEDPTNIKLSYHYDMYDNEATQWWFHKSEDHKRKEGAIKTSILKKLDSYYLGDDEKVIYLTYDEGGSDKTYIKEIVEVLNRYDIKATFFLTKNYILEEADLIREMVAAGHVIGNHTHNHLNMSTIANRENVDSFVKEITSVEKAYMQVTGKKMKKIFRFPKGEASERSMKMVSDLGYKTFFWSHAYYDYGDPLSYQDAYEAMIKYYHNGAIYLIHPNNEGNYLALEDFIKSMLDKGYTFETVDRIK